MNLDLNEVKKEDVKQILWIDDKKKRKTIQQVNSIQSKNYKH